MCAHVRVCAHLCVCVRVCVCVCVCIVFTLFLAVSQSSDVCAFHLHFYCSMLLSFSLLPFLNWLSEFSCLPTVKR